MRSVHFNLFKKDKVMNVVLNVFEEISILDCSDESICTSISLRWPKRYDPSTKTRSKKVWHEMALL